MRFACSACSGATLSLSLTGAAAALNATVGANGVASFTLANAIPAQAPAAGNNPIQVRPSTCGSSRLHMRMPLSPAACTDACTSALHAPVPFGWGPLRLG